jgi:hypothetical protein
MLEICVMAGGRMPRREHSTNAISIVQIVDECQLKAGHFGWFPMGSAGRTRQVFATACYPLAGENLAPPKPCLAAIWELCAVHSEVVFSRAVDIVFSFRCGPPPRQVASAVMIDNEPVSVFIGRLCILKVTKARLSLLCRQTRFVAQVIETFS